MGHGSVQVQVQVVAGEVESAGRFVGLGEAPTAVLRQEGGDHGGDVLEAAGLIPGGDEDTGMALAD